MEKKQNWGDKNPVGLSRFSENAKSADVADSLEPDLLSMQAISTTFCRLPQQGTPHNNLKTGSLYVQAIRCYSTSQTARSPILQNCNFVPSLEGRNFFVLNHIWTIFVAICGHFPGLYDALNRKSLGADVWPEKNADCAKNAKIAIFPGPI